MQHKIPIFGGIGSSIAITAGIMLVADYIIKLRYNNWGKGVYAKLQEFSKESYKDNFEDNCIPKSSNNQTNEKQHISCLLQNLDMADVWNSDFFKKTYDEKVKNTTPAINGWEKFREICTKDLEDLISQSNDYKHLRMALDASKNRFIRAKDDKYVAYEYCIKTKTK